MQALLADGSVTVAWEDGSESDVPRDYVRSKEDDMERLLRAAEAAGAMSSAEEGFSLC